MAAVAENSVEYIKLESAEGHIFFVDKHAVTTFSRTIQGLLDPALSELVDPNDAIQFSDISTACFEECIKFMYWKQRWADSSEDIPQFPVTNDPEVIQEMIVASNFLEC